MSNKSKALNGGKWITIATVVSTLFQFVQVAVLARLLAPADFGIVSISTLVTNFFGVFANLGFSNSIIYKQESNRNVLSTLYFLNLMVGIAIFVLIQFATPAIAAFYHEPRLEQVLGLSSYFFLIVYFGQLYLFLLEKELRFKSVALIDITGAIAGTVVTVTLAYSGYREMSLIIGSLVMQTIRTILQIALGMKFFVPALYFNLRAIMDHLRFGIFNLGEGLLGFIQLNLDSIFIGGMLGVQQLGYYTIAYQLAIFPIVKLNPIILQVAYPILAKMKEDTSSLKSSYLKILDFISYCNLPLLAGLYITAESVVPLLYGPGWEQTSYLIKIFVFVGMFAALSHPLFTLAFTKGKPNLLFYLNLTTLAIKIPLVYFFAMYWQVTGVAVAFLTASLLNLVFNFLIVQYLIGDFLRPFLRNIAKPVVFCLIMVAAVHLYKVFVGYEGPINTFVEILIGGGIYAILTVAYKLSFAEIKTYRQALL